MFIGGSEETPFGSVVRRLAGQSHERILLLNLVLFVAETEGQPRSSRREDRKIAQGEVTLGQHPNVDCASRRVAVKLLSGAQPCSCNRPAVRLAAIARSGMARISHTLPNTVAPCMTASAPVNCFAQQTPPGTSTIGLGTKIRRSF